MAKLKHYDKENNIIVITEATTDDHKIYNLMGYEIVDEGHDTDGEYFHVYEKEK